MKLWHATDAENVPSIMREGLRGNSWGIIYLTPNKDVRPWGDILLEVETGDLHLTAFEDCREWEVLCWADEPIPPSQIRIVV